MIKKQYQPSIENPCAEKWENFTATSTGGHCSSCCKNVIDFTEMSDGEILQFLSRSSERTCGRFREDQLNRPFLQTISQNTKSKRSWMKAAIASISLMLLSQLGHAQQNTEEQRVKYEIVQMQHREQLTVQLENVSGVVLEGKSGEPMVGVNVYLKGTNKGTITDADGRFDFNNGVKEGDVLVFSYIGYEPKEYALRLDNYNKIEIEMDPGTWAIMGAVAVEETYSSTPSGIKAFWAKVKALF